MQCDPNGSRFPQNDTACDVAIDQSLSGYCECMTHKVKKACSPWGFDNCYDACEEKSKYTHLKKLKLIKYNWHASLSDGHKIYINYNISSLHNER